MTFVLIENTIRELLITLQKIKNYSQLLRLIMKKTLSIQSKLENENFERLKKEAVSKVFSVSLLIRLIIL